jgi:hypothetical protein
LGQLLWLLDEAADQVTINVDVVARSTRRNGAGARFPVQG